MNWLLLILFGRVCLIFVSISFKVLFSFGNKFRSILEPCYRSTMELFVKIVVRWKPVTHFMPLVSFDTLWKHQKTWCFQGVSNKTSDMNGLNMFAKKALSWLFDRFLNTPLKFIQFIARSQNNITKKTEIFRSKIVFMKMKIKEI